VLPVNPFILFHPFYEFGCAGTGYGKTGSQFGLGNRTKGGQVCQGKKLAWTYARAFEFFSQGSKKDLKSDITVKSYAVVGFRLQ
jgi:hypothetical protein